MDARPAPRRQSRCGIVFRHRSGADTQEASHLSRWRFFTPCVSGTSEMSQERSVRHLPGPHRSEPPRSFSETSRKPLSGPHWSAFEPIMGDLANSEEMRRGPVVAWRPLDIAMRLFLSVTFTGGPPHPALRSNRLGPAWCVAKLASGKFIRDIRNKGWNDGEERRSRSEVVLRRLPGRRRWPARNRPIQVVRHPTPRNRHSLG